MNKMIEIPARFIYIRRKEEEEKPDDVFHRERLIRSLFEKESLTEENDKLDKNSSKSKNNNDKMLVPLSKSMGIDFYSFNSPYEPNEEFIELFLKNDTRVKSIFNEVNGIYVEFWSVIDAIDFYTQGFKKIKMQFATLGDAMKGMFYSGNKDKLHSSFAQHHPVTNNTQFKMKMPFKASKVSLEDAGQEVEFENKSTTAKTFDGTSHTSMTSEISLQAFSVKKDVFTLDMFEERIAHFNRLSGLYGKNDVKKIKQLYASGNREIIFKNIKELSIGAFSNVLIQEMVDQMTEDDLFTIVTLLGTDIAPISATKYGAYVVQKIITTATTRRVQKLLCDLFIFNGKYLISHEIGNYSIQKLLRFKNDEITLMFTDNLGEILDSTIGYKVFTKNIEKFQILKNRILKTLNNYKQTEKHTNIVELLNKNTQ